MVNGGYSTEKFLSTCYENVMKVSNLNIPQPEEYDVAREDRNARIRTRSKNSLEFFDKEERYSHAGGYYQGYLHGYG